MASRQKSAFNGMVKFVVEIALEQHFTDAHFFSLSFSVIWNGLIVKWNGKRISKSFRHKKCGRVVNRTHFQTAVLANEKEKNTSFHTATNSSIHWHANTLPFRFWLKWNRSTNINIRIQCVESACIRKGKNNLKKSWTLEIKVLMPWY